MKTKDLINQNKEIKDYISPNCTNDTLDRWSSSAEEGEECKFDYPPSGDEFDISKVVNVLQYQNQDEKGPDELVFNMPEIEPVTELPHIETS